MSNAQIFQQITKRLKKVDDDFADEFAKEFEDRVAQRTPVDTGHLRASWDTRVSSSQITISNDAEYAGYVEEGTEYMEGAHMLKTTMSEIPEIAKVALNRIKK